MDLHHVVADFFLIVYIGGMMAIGVIGQRKVKNADDFATARGSYGPVFLAFAFAANTASGATFLGSPGLGYEWGLGTTRGSAEIRPKSTRTPSNHVISRRVSLLAAEAWNLV